MDKDFIFLRLVEGTKKKDGTKYYFMDYLNPITFEPIRYWYNDKPLDFANLKKKLSKDCALKKFIGVCGIDEHEHAYIKDLR